MDNNEAELMETENGEKYENDSDDSKSSNADEEDLLLNRVKILEQSLTNNKYLYDTYEELIKIYRQLSDFSSLRSTYERFHQCFPLTSKIWLNWINDEKTIAQSEKEIKHIFDLFDKAVEDYLSVELWLEYAQYSLDKLDIQTTRQVLERALTAAGLDAAKGSLLWDNLRELELAQLSVLPVHTELWNEQLNRVVDTFRRQLSVPLIGMEGTYKEWEEWLQNISSNLQHEIDPKPIEWGYKKALKIVNSYKEYEDKLLITQEPVELYQVYKDYIQILTDPSTIICVYERAVAQLCLNVDVWVDFCNYSFKLGDSVLKTSSRALRNCPWYEELWIIRLRALEYHDKSNEDVMACFELGLQSITPSVGLNLWLAYLEYVHRSKDKEKLYKLFDQAIEYLGLEGDFNFKISRWCSRLLAKDGKMEEARKLWKQIVYQPQNKGSASVWLEYVNLERQYGEPSNVRLLFQRALTSCTDYPQCIADEWIMFERETGSLEDMLKCVKKCKETLIKIDKSNQMQQSIESDKKLKGTKRKDNNESSPNIKGIKRIKINEKPDIIHKKVPVIKDPKITVFISNLYPSITEKRLKEVFQNAVNVELVFDKYGKSRCYGYVQFATEEEVLSALARDRELLDGRPIYISNCKPDRNERKTAFKYSVETEMTKLFIRGLPFDKTKEDIAEIFKPYKPKEVRLVLRKDGQSKGLAYVEFENENDSRKALEDTNQMKIGDHTITVAISAPPVKSKDNVEPTATTTTRHSKSRIQLPLLPRVLQINKSNNDNEIKPNSKPSKSNADFRKIFFKE